VNGAGAERPFPPGEYPVVVVGSGPGGLQTSYFLGRLGVGHAVISADDAPGGMFRRFPLLERLITWTKPYAPAEPGSRAYEWYDWNSLLGEEPEHRDTVRPLMDGTSYFPSRAEMEAGLASFAEATGVRVRYGCRWESTERTESGFVLRTSEGEYRCRVAVFAVGMTEPWKPATPGIDGVPHYVDARQPKEYANHRVVIIGKRNSGFEIADGLLPWARRIVLVSPRPARISVLARSTAAARARYLQPYEDHVLGGGVFALDAAVEEVRRSADGWVVRCRGTTRPGELSLEGDDVMAATGFRTPLRDLPALGVATFFQGGRLPAQTPYWESPTMPGIYFAGSVTQGSVGLKKYGIPSNSAAVHGFRYNARILAGHIARNHFGFEPPVETIRPRDVVNFLLDEVTGAPEVWNQQSYLCRVLEFLPDRGIVDRRFQPLAHFVDAAGPDAVAVTVETDGEGEIHPAVYVRRDGEVSEHTLPPNTLNDFCSGEHRAGLTQVLSGLMD
jgi:thioredoxin reductase